MRKFFSFRSSYGNENENCSPAPNKSKKKAHPEATPEMNTKTSNQKKIYEGFRTPEDNVLKPLNQNLKDEISSNPHLRRSLSFSSAAVCSELNDESFCSVNDQNRTTHCHDNDQHLGQYHVRYHSSFNADRYARLESDNIWLNAIERPSSPASFGVHQHSSCSNSACSSPAPLRVRTTRSSLISSQSNALEHYIDDDHEVTKAINNSRKCTSETGGAKVAENCKIPNMGRPPRALCATSSLSHYTSDLESASLQKYLENKIERTTCGFLGKSISGIQECGSRINTPVEDTHDDSSDGNMTLNSDGTAQGCSFDFIPLDKKLDGHWLYEPVDLQSMVPCSRKGHDELFDSKVQEHDTNEGLLHKLKELEERYCLSHEEDSESEKLHHGKIKTERRHLAAELSLQIRRRLAERTSAKERLKQSMLELNTRTRRLEKEKNELKLGLENELSRRTNDWSSKVSKFQSEEQRMRERVRELAEQNVALQREISLIQGSELEARNSVVNIERQLNESRTSQDELKTENNSLHQALLNKQEHCNSAEEQLDHLRNSSKESERENLELRKLVGRLQRTCSEQDKTITGLRQSFSSEFDKKFLLGDNDVVQLQTEKMRLTGVEQRLRGELESCRIEVESLRNENIQLLHHLRGTGNGNGFSLVRMNLELHAWAESLKMQSLSLLDDSSSFCGQLLSFTACKRSESFDDTVHDTDEYSVVELSLKYQDLTRAIGNFRRNLQILSMTLDENASIQASKCMCKVNEIDSGKDLKNSRSQDDIEVELKAEAILTRLLREKICSRELEIEQLHKDLASSIRRYDALQTDVRRLQDEFSCLNHTKMDLETQVLKKDENILLLQQDLQECTKSLSATRATLSSVSEERNHMWEEVKRLRESTMLMDYEIKSLHKKIEILDEDVLYKEGQICILKDSVTKHKEL